MTLPRRPLSVHWVVPAAALFLAGCQEGVLDPRGPVGAAENKILINSLVVMLGIVIPTIVTTLGIVWWFRASNARARYRPDFAYSGRIELVTWSIPILVILFLGGVAWVGSHDLDPGRPIDSSAKPVEVQVVSLDWKWLFIYPEQHVASVNELVVPAGTPIHFTLTSGSVMTAFFVPQLGTMIYTMNGMATQLWLQADHPGFYYGRASHFSGDGFPGMQFELRAVTPAQYAAWLDSTQGTGRSLDAQAYAELEKQSADVRPFTYSSADAGLFQAIVTQHLPPGPGPQTGRGGPGVSPVHVNPPQPEG